MINAQRLEATVAVANEQVKSVAEDGKAELQAAVNQSVNKVLPELQQLVLSSGEEAHANSERSMRSNGGDGNAKNIARMLEMVTQDAVTTYEQRVNARIKTAQQSVTAAAFEHPSETSTG